MIKVYTAYTDEVDDVEFAVDSIKKQIGALKKNSVGFVSCYADFIETGVFKAVCGAFPFDIIGTPTLANATPESEGDILFTLTVFTSDDNSFAVGLSAPISGEDAVPLEAAYSDAAARLGVKPDLMLSVAPLLVFNTSGDFYANAFDKISGGLPNFGTVTVDHHEDYHSAFVLCRGEAYADRYAFILIGGGLKPDFFVTGISPEKVFQEKGLVTASAGNQLQKVNNVPVIDYLVSLGLTLNEEGSITGVNSFPFIIDMNDGTDPVIRGAFAITPDGSAVCGGNIPVGSIISVASSSAEEVLATTEKAVSQIAASGKYSFVMMFSCVGRYFSLGYEPTREMDKIKSILGKAGLPFSLTYSGGELCPVRAADNSTVNRNHNDTLIICAF